MGATKELEAYLNLKVPAQMTHQDGATLSSHGVPLYNFRDLDKQDHSLSPP